MALTTIQYTGNEPHPGSALAAGHDLTITETITIHPGRIHSVGTGAQPVTTVRT